MKKERVPLLNHQSDSRPEENKQNEEVEVTIEIPPIVHTGFIGRFFPFGFQYELKKLCLLAIPITITSLIAFLSGPISVIFAGRLGKSALATVGLSVSLFNVTGLAVVTGLLTAVDTLFAQTYGSNHKHLMGIQLQRACLLITLCCLPCMALHLLAEPILLSLKQNPLTAKLSAEYLLYLTPGLWFAAIGQVFTKYIQTQNRVYPPLFIGIGANGLNAALHYILLFVVEIGVKGSAIAQVAAYALQALVFLFFIIYTERDGTTWRGFSKKCWLDWDIWFKLALPGLVMITLEWIVFEIGTVVAGTLGERQLAAQTILFNVETLSYTLLPLGFGMATNIRVGQFLGARSAIGPKSVTSVALVTLWCLSLGFVVGISVLRWYIPRIFTADSGVIETTATLLPLIATFQIFDGTVGVCSGAIRGAGLQFVGAIICFVTLYVMGAPIGLCLVFLAGYDLRGLWIGLTIGTVLEGITYCIICQNINWEKQVCLAIERTRDHELRAEHPELPARETSASDAASTSSSGSSSQVSSASSSSSSLSSLENQSNSRSTSVRPSTRTKLKSVYPVRIALIFFILTIFIVSVCLRTHLNWSNYFGKFCVFANDTYISLINDSYVPVNCTIVIPGQTQSIFSLP